MNCPKCANENTDDALFCKNCGASLKIQDPSLCPHCNNEISNSAKFCNKCGISLGISNPQGAQEKQEDKSNKDLDDKKEVKKSNKPFKSKSKTKLQESFIFRTGWLMFAVFFMGITQIIITLLPAAKGNTFLLLFIVAIGFFLGYKVTTIIIKGIFYSDIEYKNPWWRIPFLNKYEKV